MSRSDRLAIGLMELAANQQGLLSVAQAHEAGLDGRALRRLVERGLLTRERRGIYLVTGVRRRPLHAAIEAVVLAGGVLSHRSAAELHGIGTQLSGRTEVTVVRPRHPRSQPGVIIRQTRRLDRTELTIIGGLNVGRTGMMHADFLSSLLGNGAPLTTAVDIIIGLSALYQIYPFVRAFQTSEVGAEVAHR